MSNMSFANNAATTLASSITNSATSLTVQTGAGASFPTLTGIQYFYCTLENGSGSNREIVKVTARATDTFTIVRGQDGTTGTAFNAGDKVELRLVRANLQDFALLDEANTFTQQQTVSAGLKFNDGTTQTTAAVSSTLNGIYAQAFTSNGTFTIPTGVTAVKITVIAGGGGGGSSSGTQLGGTGGSSSVVSGALTITATGGSGGQYVGACGCTPAQLLPGSGGSASNGTLNIGGQGGVGTGLGGSTTFGYGYGSGGNGYVAPMGGGGGGTAIKYITGLTPGNTMSVVIGGGGAAAYSNANPGYGGLVLIEW